MALLLDHEDAGLRRPTHASAMGPIFSPSGACECGDAAVREIINDAIGRAINTSGDASCGSIYQAWRNLKAWRDLRLPPLRDRVPSKYSPKYGRAGSSCCRRCNLRATRSRLPTRTFRLQPL